MRAPSRAPKQTPCPHRTPTRAPESLIWRVQVRVLVETGLHPDFNADAIRGWSLEARSAARVQSRQAAQDNLKSLWKFVDDQLRAGAGALHKLAKRQPIAADAAPRDNKGRTMDPQRVVNHECEAGKRIWMKFEGVAAAPWRIREGGVSGRADTADISEDIGESLCDGLSNDRFDGFLRDGFSNYCFSDGLSKDWFDGGFSNFCSGDGFSGNCSGDDVSNSQFEVTTDYRRATARGSRYVQRIHW